MLLELINNKEKENCPPKQQSTTKSETTLRDIYSITNNDEIPRDIEDAALHVIRHKIKNSNHPNKTIEFKSGGPRVS